VRFADARNTAAFFIFSLSLAGEETEKKKMNLDKAEPFLFLIQTAYSMKCEGKEKWK
jgi:hypothetical protein